VWIGRAHVRRHMCDLAGGVERSRGHVWIGRAHVRRHMCDLASRRGGSGGLPPTARESARFCHRRAATPLQASANPCFWSPHGRALQRANSSAAQVLRLDEEGRHGRRSGRGGGQVGGGGEEERGRQVRARSFT
jgi:hypothetical protein